jgi:hypothetical protein
MCNLATKQPPVKSRSAHLSPRGESGRHILTLSEGKKATVYWLEVLEVDFGFAVRLEKFTDGTSYDVNVCLSDPRHSSCECLGFVRWGHRHLCKHISAVVALHNAGRL